jgi:hypothetical protein
MPMSPKGRNGAAVLLIKESEMSKKLIGVVFAMLLSVVVLTGCDSDSRCPKGGEYRDTANGGVCMVTTVVDGVAIYTVYAPTVDQAEIERQQAETKLAAQAKTAVTIVTECPGTGQATGCLSSKINGK